MYNKKKARKHHEEYGCGKDAQEGNYEQLKKLEYSQQWMTVGDQCEIILTQVNRWRFCYQLEVRRYPLVRIEALQQACGLKKAGMFRRVYRQYASILLRHVSD